MTLEKFNEMVASIEVEQRAIYSKAKEIFNSGERSLHAYEIIGAVKVDAWRTVQGFLQRFDVISTTIDREEIEDLIEILHEFQNRHKECDGIGKSNIYYTSDVGDEYINHIGYKYHYYTFSEEKLEHEIMRLSRKRIEEELKPASAKYAVTPDCKIVQLFRDGAIDWETLQKITYSNCGI